MMEIIVSTRFDRFARLWHFARSTLDSALWPSVERAEGLLMQGCGSTLAKAKNARTHNPRLTERKP